MVAMVRYNMVTMVTEKETAHGYQSNKVTEIQLQHGYHSEI